VLSFVINNYTPAPPEGSILFYLRPSVLPSVRSSVLPSVRPSFRPFVRPSFRPSVRSSVLPSVQDNFRRIFLSNYWLQKSDIWSQASYRYAILWEAFLDQSDSYFLFAELCFIHIEHICRGSSQFILLFLITFLYYFISFLIIYLVRIHIHTILC